MINIDKYKQEVEDASMIKYDVYENHIKVLGQISKLYKGLFNRNPKEFNEARNILFYKGGYPSDTTPSKAYQIASKIADSFFILSLLGKEKMLNDHLASRGLKLEIVDKKTYTNSILDDFDWQNNKKRAKLVNEIWNQHFVDEIPNEPEEFLNLMLDKAIYCLENICKANDTLNKEVAPRVEEECEVKPSTFMKSVNLTVQKTKGKNIEENLTKLKSDAEEVIESMEIFE